MWSYIVIYPSVWVGAVQGMIVIYDDLHTTKTRDCKMRVVFIKYKSPFIKRGIVWSTGCDMYMYCIK